MGETTLKRRDMGFTGAVILLAQVMATLQSSRNLSNELDELKNQFNLVKTEQAKYFVKREELKQLALKLDAMNDQLIKIGHQIRKFKDDYALKEDLDGLGCLNETSPDLALNGTFIE